MARRVRVANWGTIQDETGPATAQVLRRILGSGKSAGGGAGGGAGNPFTGINNPDTPSAQFPLRLYGSGPQLYIGHSGVTDDWEFHAKKDGSLYMTSPTRSDLTRDFYLTADGNAKIKSAGAQLIQGGTSVSSLVPNAGSIESDLVLWVRADTLVNPPVDGSQISNSTQVTNKKDGDSNYYRKLQAGTGQVWNASDAEINGEPSFEQVTGAYMHRDDLGAYSISGEFTIIATYHPADTSPDATNMLGAQADDTLAGFMLPSLATMSCLFYPDGQQVSDGSSLDVNTFHIVIIRRDSGDNLHLYVDGVDVSAGVSNADILYIGKLFACRASTVASVGSKLADLVVYSADLGEATAFQVHNYMALRYDLPTAGSVSDFLQLIATDEATIKSVFDGTGQLHIGGSSPSAALHVTKTTEQARLAFDSDDYVSFTVDSAGDLTITPTGNTVTVLNNVSGGPAVQQDTLVLQTANAKKVTLSLQPALGASVDWDIVAQPSTGYLEFTDQTNSYTPLYLGQDNTVYISNLTGTGTLTFTNIVATDDIRVTGADDGSQIPQLFLGPSGAQSVIGCQFIMEGGSSTGGEALNGTGDGAGQIILTRGKYSAGNEDKWSRPQMWLLDHAMLVSASFSADYSGESAPDNYDRTEAVMPIQWLWRRTTGAPQDGFGGRLDLCVDKPSGGATPDYRRLGALIWQYTATANALGAVSLAVATPGTGARENPHEEVLRVQAISNNPTQKGVTIAGGSLAGFAPTANHILHGKKDGVGYIEAESTDNNAGLVLTNATGAFTHVCDDQTHTPLNALRLLEGATLRETRIAYSKTFGAVEVGTPGMINIVPDDASALGLVLQQHSSVVHTKLMQVRDNAGNVNFQISADGHLEVDTSFPDDGTGDSQMWVEMAANTHLSFDMNTGSTFRWVTGTEGSWTAKAVMAADGQLYKGAEGAANKRYATEGDANEFIGINTFKEDLRIERVANDDGLIICDVDGSGDACHISTTGTFTGDRFNVDDKFAINKAGNLRMDFGQGIYASYGADEQTGGIYARSHCYFAKDFAGTLSGDYALLRVAGVWKARNSGGFSAYGCQLGNTWGSAEAGVSVNDLIGGQFANSIISNALGTGQSVVAAIGGQFTVVSTKAEAMSISSSFAGRFTNNIGGGNHTIINAGGIGIPTPAAFSPATANQYGGVYIFDQGGVGTNSAAILVRAQTSSPSAVKGNLWFWGVGYDEGHIQLDNEHIWSDGSGILLRANAPGSDSDGILWAGATVKLGDVDGTQYAEFAADGALTLHGTGAELLFAEVSAPSTPAANYATTYLDSTTEELHIKKDDGEVHNLERNGFVLQSYVDLKERNQAYRLHGLLENVVTAGAVSSGSPQAATIGLGKVIIVVNAGSDTSGSLTVTGTSVDRNDGTETGPSDTDTLTINGLTTDNTDTDADSNTRWAFSNAYITSKWFTGSITISTTDVNLSDIDVYLVAFEQFNDNPDTEIDTIDITAYANNTSAWLYAYLYHLEVSGDTCSITRETTADIAWGAAKVTTTGSYRLRRGNLALANDGTSDGMWCELHLGPTTPPTNYWENINHKLWGSQPKKE